MLELKKVAWRPKKCHAFTIFQRSELLFPKNCCPVGHTGQRSSYELVTNNKRNVCPLMIYQELMSQYLEHEIRPLPLVLPPGTISLCRSPCSSRSPWFGERFVFQSRGRHSIALSFWQTIPPSPVFIFLHVYWKKRLAT